MVDYALDEVCRQLFVWGIRQWFNRNPSTFYRPTNQLLSSTLYTAIQNQHSQIQSIHTIDNSDDFHQSSTILSLQLELIDENKSRIQASLDFVNEKLCKSGKKCIQEQGGCERNEQMNSNTNIQLQPTTTDEYHGNVLEEKEDLFSHIQEADDKEDDDLIKKRELEIQFNTLSNIINSQPCL